MVTFFFFKQKTAYEMRISDWSSDVCSSDLQQGVHPLAIPVTREVPDAVLRPVGPDIVAVDDQDRIAAQLRQRLDHPPAGFEQLLPLVGHQIGRASCRGRVCQYV